MHGRTLRHGFNVCWFSQGLVLGNASLTTHLHLVTSIVQIVIHVSVAICSTHLYLGAVNEAVTVPLALAFCCMMGLSLVTAADEGLA